jgi:hypothetical protein
MKLYIAIGIITFVIQLYWRVPVCSGAMGVRFELRQGRGFGRQYGQSTGGS